MHNSFIFQQYVCYTTLLNMFRAARCSSLGGSILSPQPLVSSPSVSSRTVCRWRAVRSPPAYCTAVYRGWRYQRLWWYNWSYWGWAVCCSKHVEERSVTYILLKNKRIVHYVGNLKKSILWCMVRKTSNDILVLSGHFLNTNLKFYLRQHSRDCFLLIIIIIIIIISLIFKYVLECFSKILACLVLPYYKNWLIVL